MNKLVIHTGYFKVRHPTLEVVRVTSLSPAQRVATGRSLRPSPNETIRNVFIDDPFVFRGLQEAVGSGELNPESVLIVYDPGKQLEKHLIHILPKGDLDVYPTGFLLE